ncbi:putative Annexin A13 [Hypsibius exemplaris]|uniref:Annexin A13 n=1 Tax=Hypsibius exemplaris TaxID=2072580 RepID=A0A1W0WUH0_HYPEX|nr:putative Annexin A13 [Hypsibius exemplaris]
MEPILKVPANGMPKSQSSSSELLHAHVHFEDVDMRNSGEEQSGHDDPDDAQTTSSVNGCAAAYSSQYHKNLTTVIKHELNIVGHYEQTLLALLQPPADYDAHELHHALSASKLLLDEETLIEILCSRNNHDLHHIRTAYMALYNKDLMAVIKHDTKGEFEHLLVALLSARREEGPSVKVDMDRAIADAKQMHGAEVQHWAGHPESVFIDILATRSYNQLSATFHQFEKITGHDIEKSIQEQMHGDVRTLMLALVKYVKNKHAFFAECLYNAVKGLRTNDARLIRIIVGRCEKDLGNIKMEFAQIYGHSLQAAVKSDTHGNYRHILLALAGYEHNY